MADAAALGAVCGTMYYGWDACKLGVGKGGRLGTIALVANLVYYGVRHNSGGLEAVAVQTLGALGPVNAVVAVASGLVLHFSRRSNQAADEKPNSVLLRSVLTGASKVMLLAAVVGRLWWTIADSSNKYVKVADWVRTTTTIFAASMVVRKSPGVVLPPSLVGLAGSLFAPSNVAAPIYLGAFLGMTRLQNFKVPAFVQSSIFAATLFHLGLFDGFGGKLGFLSFLGVLFGM